MPLTDVWASLKARSALGDVGDRIRSLPLVQRVRGLNVSATPIITFERFPALLQARRTALQAVGEKAKPKSTRKVKVM